MNKFLEQKERGEPILFTELLKEIPCDDVLLELFSDGSQPQHPLLTRHELEIMKLRLKGTPYKTIANQLNITCEQISRLVQKIKKFLAEGSLPSYVFVNIPLLNPCGYTERIDILSKRQLDVWTLYAQGESRKSIAQKVGITPGAVTQHIHNADRRFREHDKYCAAEKRNLEPANLSLTRGEVKVIMKSLKVYEDHLERGIIRRVGSDYVGKLPVETIIVSDLYEKAQIAIYGEALVKMLPNRLKVD